MCDAHVWLCAHACQGTHGEVKGQLSGIRSPRSAPDSGAQTQVGGFIQQVLLADEPSCWTPLGWFILDACLLMSTQDFLQWCHMSPKKMSTARLYLTEWSDTLGSLKWIANLSLLNTKCAFYGKSKCFNGIITFIYLFYVCPWSIVWLSEVSLWEIVLSSHHVGVGSEFRASGSSEIIFTILLVWKGKYFNLCREA